MILFFSHFVMIEMSQKKTYSTWDDIYRTKEMSFQIVQNKFTIHLVLTLQTLQMLIGMK